LLHTTAGFAALPRTARCPLHGLLLTELAGAKALQGRQQAMRQEPRIGKQWKRAWQILIFN